MAGSEALFQVADPLHSKLNMQYICWYNMVDKKNLSISYLKKCFVHLIIREINTIETNNP